MIDVQLTKKLGLIGYRNHAKRLLDILNSYTDFEVTHIYHPTKKIVDPLITNDIDSMYDCDAIIIASPNSTHFNYIMKFIKNSNCFIFCEKPPCTSIEEIEKLDSLGDNEKHRIFFNFNYRFSETSKIIKDSIHSEKIGKIIHISIVSTHGLAFKDGYNNSWRADGKTNLHNILETVTIHFLDLLNLHFGEISNCMYIPNKFSDQGNSFDTCHILLEYKNGLTCSILNSYASSYIEEISIIGTNGHASVRDNILNKFYPRDTFDDDGFFDTPPKMHEETVNTKLHYKNSLQSSVDYFLTHIKNREPFQISDFDLSLSTNKQILNLKNNL